MDHYNIARGADASSCEFAKGKRVGYAMGGGGESTSAGLKAPINPICSPTGPLTGPLDEHPLLRTQ